MSIDTALPNLAEGSYAKKQLFTKSRLINWSHGARFQLGVKLAQLFAGKSILDYGSGDGTFLALLMAGDRAPAAAVGAELDDRQILECRNRHQDPRLSFLRIAELDDPSFEHAFDGIVCMEVLEHVVDLHSVFETWRRVLKPGGRLLISVPVETGPVLAAKQVMRRIAGWRGIGDYPGMAPYNWSEFSRSLIARNRQHMPRPVYTGPDGSTFHCHKGFNWRALRGALAARFTLERQLSSPLSILPAGLGSQAWFVLRNH